MSFKINFTRIKKRPYRVNFFGRFFFVIETLRVPNMNGNGTIVSEIWNFKGRGFLHKRRVKIWNRAQSCRSIASSLSIDLDLDHQNF
jgi:hypothetical protein